MALSLWPRRAYRSPIVLETVSSLGSAFRTFSYSAVAFCSLPCWTNFSAALRTFCLLKPKPNAISVRAQARTPEHILPENVRCPDDPNIGNFWPIRETGHLDKPDCKSE